MKYFAFSTGNAKLGKHITTFALPAGYSCPAAVSCLTWANKTTGKIEDGSLQNFRCFSASQEAYSSSVRKSRWKNFESARELIKGGGVQALTAQLLEELPKTATLVRVHVSGDFFSQNYFDAWMDVAKRSPGIKFYAYTKAINFWVERLATIPHNFLLTASLGGAWDKLAVEKQLPTAEVVLHPEATEKPIDHDDSHAYDTAKPKHFALLIHGGQKKGSEAISAIKRLKNEGIKFSYPKKSKKVA